MPRAKQILHLRGQHRQRRGQGRSARMRRSPVGRSERGPTSRHLAGAAMLLGPRSQLVVRPSRRHPGAGDDRRDHTGIRSSHERARPEPRGATGPGASVRCDDSGGRAGRALLALPGAGRPVGQTPATLASSCSSPRRVPRHSPRPSGPVWSATWPRRWPGNMCRSSPRSTVRSCATGSPPSSAKRWRRRPTPAHDEAQSCLSSDGGSRPRSSWDAPRPCGAGSAMSDRRVRQPEGRRRSEAPAAPRARSAPGCRAG